MNIIVRPSHIVNTWKLTYSLQLGQQLQHSTDDRKETITLHEATDTQNNDDQGDADIDRIHGKQQIIKMTINWFVILIKEAFAFIVIIF